MKYLSVIVVILVVLVIWSVGSYVAVRGIEKPQYTVVEQREGYEIRRYETYIVAEVLVDGQYQEALNEGFMKVADYIFGNNTKRTDIAMTAPVLSEESQLEYQSEKIAMTSPVLSEPTEEGQQFSVAFIMPSKYSMTTLPEPNNDQINIREVSEQTVAVLKFSWYATDSRIQKKQQQLMDQLKADGIEMLSLPRVAQYNPPLSAPWMRTNEIQIRIKSSN